MATRRDEGHELTEKELAKLEKRIAKVYRQAGKELQGTIDAYFEKFKERDEEMKALIGTVVNGKEWTEQDYKHWRLNQIARGERYQAMREKVAKRMTDANEVAVSYTNDATPGIYSLNRNYAAYTIEQVSPNADFTLWDEQTVKRLIVEEPDLMPYYPKARAVKRGIDLAYGKKQITASVTSSILQGKSIKGVADDLQDRITTMSRASAIRTARTAVTGAQNAGRMDSYVAAQKMGIKLKREWLATLDNRTRHAHAMLDGQQAEMGKPFKVDGYDIMYPGDTSAPAYLVYNCRCTLVAAVDGVDTSDAKRRARSPLTGETELVSDMTYQEWAGWKQKEQKSEDAAAVASWIKTGDLPPHMMEYDNWYDYVAARNAYNGTIEYVSGSEWNNVHIYDEHEMQNAKRFDATIAQLEEKYPLPAGHRLVIGDYENVQHHLTEIQRSRIGDEATAQHWVNPDTNKVVIGFRPNQATSTLAEDLTKRQKAIDIGDVLSDVFYNSPEGIAIHEYGHEMGEYLTRGMIFGDEDAMSYWNWYKSLDKEDITKGLSRYAATNRWEFEAEAFTELQTSNPRPIAKRYGEYLAKLIEKNYNTDSLESGLPEKLSKKLDTSSIKTVSLPKQEYAHVMSEIATNLTERQKKQSIVTKAIGKYIYTFENHGFGDYRIIGKKLIDNEVSEWWDD